MLRLFISLGLILTGCDYYTSTITSNNFPGDQVVLIGEGYMCMGGVLVLNGKVVYGQDSKLVTCRWSDEK